VKLCSVLLIFAVFGLGFSGSPTTAAQPSDRLLPQTTKGYISAGDIDRLRSKWDETQLGKLAQDPVMKPFAEDLRRQLKEKLSETGVRVGLAWEDIEAIYGGEVCLAAILPEDNVQPYAFVALVEVRDHVQQAQALLEKVAKNMEQRKATRATKKVGPVELAIYKIPPKSNEALGRTVVLCLVDDQLVASDHQAVAEQIVARMEGESEDTLATLPAYQQIMERTADASGQEAEFRWFVEPLGYARVLRSASGRKRRGTDLLKVLTKQGFTAIQGIGGHFHLSTEDHQWLHRTFVYAPAVTRPEGSQDQDKYDLAARMLDFPNRTELQPQSWIPRELAMYGTFFWKMPEAFEHSETLVDEVAGDKGFFDDLLESLATDPSGPQIDLRKELVAFLGERATMIADYAVPITPRSERLLFAVEITDPESVAANINRAMENDPDARKLELEGMTIWEIITEPEEEIPTLTVDGPGFNPIPGTEPAEEEESERILPNSAITVAHGQLMVATNIDLLLRVINLPGAEDTLDTAADYRAVQEALTKLGAGDDSFRFFSRTDEEYRPVYELIRQNRMPEAKTLLGRSLNRILGPQEKGVLREQQIDGSKLPEFQVVRRYLGPAGLYVRSEEDGWMVTGVLLTKDQPHESSPEEPAVTTARADAE
jgi:hypothetical protein